MPRQQTPQIPVVISVSFRVVSFMMSQQRQVVAPSCYVTGSSQTQRKPRCAELIHKQMFTFSDASEYYVVARVCSRKCYIQLKDKHYFTIDISFHCRHFSHFITELEIFLFLSLHMTRGVGCTPARSLKIA